MKTTSINEHIERFNTEPSGNQVEAYFTRLTKENQDYAKDSIENGYLREDENKFNKWAYDDGEYLVGESCLYQWCCQDNTEDLQYKYAYISAVLEMINNEHM